MTLALRPETPICDVVLALCHCHEPIGHEGHHICGDARTDGGIGVCGGSWDEEGNPVTFPNVDMDSVFYRLFGGWGDGAL